MIIEIVESFGLAHIHLLMCRVTRVNLHSNCVLVHNNNLSEIFSEIDKNSKNIFEINLEDQEFEIKSSGKKEKFKISTYKKSNMSNGFDDIDYLINKKDQISAFANKLRY